MNLYRDYLRKEEMEVMSKEGKIREPALQRLVNPAKGKSKSKGLKVAPTGTGSRGDDYFKVRTQPRIKNPWQGYLRQSHNVMPSFLFFARLEVSHILMIQSLPWVPGK